MKKQALRLALFATLAAPVAAFATTGYLQHGYGIKAKGMGGVGIALPQDSIAAAINPAGMAFVGNRLDAGLDWFRPQRQSEITGNIFPGVNGTYDANGEENFFIPEFGYNRMIRPNLALGVSVFGNGGMNTTYTRPVPLFGTSNLEMDYAQLFISPTIAWKLNEQHAIGAALNIAYHRFKAQGLENFAFPPPFNASSSPGDVTNRGYDSSWGWSLRIGWTGKVTEAVTLGATYQTKTKMGSFDKYRGLFAEQGDLDVPENYGVGIAFKPTQQWTLAGDVQRIKYNGVKSIGTTVDCLFAGQCLLGASNGAGFGWQDTTVYKLGVSYEWSKALTLRAGFVTLDQPIPSSQTLFNIIAPGVVENHLTLGLTWNIDRDKELSFSYMHAFEKTVNGSGSIPPGPPPGFGGGEANLKMYQDALGVAFGWKI
jgi:long-chain fatty acid transport protein